MQTKRFVQKEGRSQVFGKNVSSLLYLRVAGYVRITADVRYLKLENTCC